MSQGNNELKLKENNNTGRNENANTLQTETRQNFIPMPVSFPQGDPASRLMGTKIVRIRFATKCACVKGCKKLFYHVNTVSKIDDIHPEAEMKYLCLMSKNFHNVIFVIFAVLL